jgi:hypothetical protein
VRGNGVDNIATLIATDLRLRRTTDSAKHECRYEHSYVPALNETVRLSTIASTRVGGAYRDASECATPELLARVEAVARDMGVFLAGRFDVRYGSLASLQRGEFTIMEVNGAGSEAAHAWDARYSIRDVYRIVFAKQRLLFQIGDANRRLGYRPIGWRRLASLYIGQLRTMRAYPPSN